MQEKSRKIIIKVLIWIVVIFSIIAAIYLIWGIQGICTTCLIIAAIAGFGALSVLRSDTDGCGIFFILLAVAAVFGFLGDKIAPFAEEAEIKNNSLELYESITRNPSIDQCEKYMSMYKYSENADDVQQILLYLLVDNAKNYDFTKITSTSKDRYYTSNTPIEKLSMFADNNQSNKFGREASLHLISICDSLYNLAKENATIAGWRAYQRAVPSSFFKDSEIQIENIENKNWDTEAKAWNSAKKQNNIRAYQKYKKLYPTGRHYAQAEKTLIDLEVDKVYASDHGSLPDMDKISWENGPTAHISVTNSTSYTLTLLYSGPDSKRLIISHGETSFVTLKNGRYRVAASVNASNVRNYAGTEDVSGGRYSVTYYISTYRY